MCFLAASQATSILLTSITVSSPWHPSPQLFGQGWVTSGLPLSSWRSDILPLGNVGFLHFVLQWVRNVDVVTATSTCDLIGSEFPFQKARVALACSLRHIYISCLSAFFHFFSFPPKIAYSLGSAGTISVLCLCGAWPLCWWDHDSVWPDCEGPWWGSALFPAPSSPLWAALCLPLPEVWGRDLFVCSCTSFQFPSEEATAGDPHVLFLSLLVPVASFVGPLTLWFRREVVFTSTFHHRAHATPELLRGRARIGVLHDCAGDHRVLFVFWYGWHFSVSCACLFLCFCRESFSEFNCLDYHLTKVYSNSVLFRQAFPQPYRSGDVERVEGTPGEIWQLSLRLCASVCVGK